jgi:hypothetical protein
MARLSMGIFGVHGEDRVKGQGILMHDAGFRMHDKAIADCGIIEERWRGEAVKGGSRG